MRRRRVMGALVALSLVAASCGSGADPALESTAGVLDPSDAESVASTETTVEARAELEEGDSAQSPAVPLPPTVAGDSVDGADADAAPAAEAATGDETADEATAAPEAAAPAAAAEPAPKAPAAAATPAPAPAPAPATPAPAPTTATTAAPTSSTTTTAAPAANSFPSVQVIDIASGNSVNMSSRLAGDGRPVLLWFWSPF